MTPGGQLNHVKKNERWVYLTCEICGKEFPYSSAKYNYQVSVGDRPQRCCSQACGAEYKRRKKARKVAGL